MSKPTTLRASRTTIVLNKVKTFFSKPHNVILLLLGIVLTFTTVAPIVAIVQDTFKIHAGTIDAHLTGQASGYTTVNYIDLFTSRMAKTNLWTPLLNTVLLAVGTCIVSILYGGLFAFLITRTDLAWRKYLSSIFIFPYIMPQWTLAVVWQNLFNSNAVTGTSNGLRLFPLCAAAGAGRSARRRGLQPARRAGGDPGARRHDPAAVAEGCRHRRDPHAPGRSAAGAGAAPLAAGHGRPQRRLRPGAGRAVRRAAARGV